jgi:isopentenyldiphosphate isomerase
MSNIILQERNEVKNMELWDVYDKHGNITGRKIQRENINDLLGEDEYHLVVHIYIRNSKGQFLVQKRSEKKQFLPGIWDITAGCAVSGDDGITAAMRETEEELGIALKPEDFTYIGRFRRGKCFMDLFEVVKDIDLSTCILQEGEVDDVKYISKEELFQQINNGPFGDDGYNDVIFKYYSSI